MKTRKTKTKDNASPNGVGGSIGDDGLSGASGKAVVEAGGGLEAVSESDGKVILDVNVAESDKENEDPVAVVSPPVAMKKTPSLSTFNRLKNQFKLQGRKLKQVLESVVERDAEIDKLKADLVKKNCLLASKDTNIENLKTRIESIQRRKSAIQESAVAGCTATIELYKAKFEAGKQTIADLRKSFKRANRMLDSHEKQALSMKNRLNESLAVNSQLTEQVHNLRSECRDLRKNVTSLKHQKEKLVQDNSERNLQREQVALERDRIKIAIAKEQKMRAVLKEEAAESRQVNVEKTKAQLKEEALRKRKADKERDAHLKQAENNRKLKAARTMMMNCGGDDGSVASYHYGMNRGNPDNGMFLNSRQLRQNINAGMNISEYDASMSVLAGEREPAPRQLTLTQCAREGRLAPPPAPKKPPLPNPKDLPPGVKAQRDTVSGIIYYKSIDNETGEVYVDTELDRLMSTKRSPPPQTRDSTRDSAPIRNITMSQLSDLTQTPVNHSLESASTDGEEHEESHESDEAPKTP